MKKITVIVGIAAICTTMTACGSFFKNNDNYTPVNGTVTPTTASTVPPSAAVTATPTAVPEPTQADVSVTDAPPATDVVTTTPVPTITMSPTPVVEPLTQEEAFEILRTYIDTSVYTVSVAEQINIDGKMYYKYTISDASQVYEPDVIVASASGDLYYYDSYNVLSAFESFPPDKTETVDSQGETLTKEEAITLLKTLSAEDLLLPASIDNYELKVDNWNTVVKGTECYCINVLSNTDGAVALVGMYYVSLDGSMIYRNDADDFTLIY